MLTYWSNKDLEIFIPLNLRHAVLSKNVFVRVFDNTQFYIQNDQILVKTIKFKTDYIKSIPKKRKLVNKLITMDIETYVQDGEHIPYCICYFDGEKKYSFYYLYSLMSIFFLCFVQYIYNTFH